MNSIAQFNEVEKETDVAAFNAIPFMIPMIFGEIHVLRSLFVYLAMIAGNIVIYPFQLIMGIKNLKEPQYKYGLCIFLSSIIPFIVPYLLGYDVELAMDFVKGQKFYKIWAIYTLFFIIQKFLAKVHIYTHKIIRGAIREGKSVLAPILLHSISNFIILFAYNVYSGTYLAGLYGKKEGIFISVCLHIQTVITKKFLPKVLDIPPQFSWPIARMVMIYSIVLHLSMGNFEQVIPIIEYEYLFVFIRTAFVAISGDSVLFYQCLKIGADNAFYQFNHNDANIDSSIIANVPIEPFVIYTLFLITKGPIVNTVVIIGVVIIYAILGRIIIKYFCPTTKPIIPGKKSKKDKKNKDGGKDKTGEKDKTGDKDAVKKENNTNEGDEKEKSKTD